MLLLRCCQSSKTLCMVQILIRNRATDLDARMHDGTTPLILATRLAVEGMVEELINSHADPNTVDDSGMNTHTHCQHAFTVCKYTMDLISVSLSVGKSALHWAAAVNNVDAAVVLLKNGANKDLQNNKVCIFYLKTFSRIVSKIHKH